MADTRTPADETRRFIRGFEVHLRFMTLGHIAQACLSSTEYIPHHNEDRELFYQTILDLSEE